MTKFHYQIKLTNKMAKRRIFKSLGFSVVNSSIKTRHLFPFKIALHYTLGNFIAHTLVIDQTSFQIVKSNISAVQDPRTHVKEIIRYRILTLLLNC